MQLKGKQIGFILPEAHFSMSAILNEVKKMVTAGAAVFPLFLATSDKPEVDEQFSATQKLLEQITGKEIMTTSLTEESGEQYNDDPTFDMLVIAPCPGNFLAKLINARNTAAPLGSTLQHLQAGRPIVLALVANGDSQNLFSNVQQILSMKTLFLVPFGPTEKGDKHIYLSRLDLLYETVAFAMEQRQLQPVYLEPCWLPPH
jgi:dipicolinate synthase subunit B